MNILFEATMLSNIWLLKQKNGIFRVSEDFFSGFTANNRCTTYAFCDSSQEYACYKYFQQLYSSEFSGYLCTEAQRRWRWISRICCSLTVHMPKKKVMSFVYKSLRKICDIIYMGFTKRKKFIETDDFDMVFSPYIIMQSTFVKPVRKAIVVYDTIPFLFPQFCEKNNRVYSILPNIPNDYVVFVFTKVVEKDFLKLRPDFSEDNVVVVPMGISRKIRKVSTNGLFLKFLKEKNIPDDSILFLAVGTIEPRKNLRTAIEAIRIEKKRNPKVCLLIIGSFGWLYSDLLEVMNQAIAERCVVVAGSVSDELLIEMYSNAFALIFPSWYEGFGLPPVEALRCGLPSIVSDIPVFHETLSQYAYFADPESPQDFSDKMHEMINEGNILDMAGSVMHSNKYDWIAASDSVLQTIYY